MRFFRRSLTGIFLLALTVGLLSLAGDMVYSALQASWVEEDRARPARACASLCAVAVRCRPPPPPWCLQYVRAPATPPVGY